MGEERELTGPGGYEKYNNISINAQKQYLKSIKSQILLLLSIALLSLFPSSFQVETDLIKHSVELILIIIVLLLMILQYKSNNMEGWQNARYLAESILSNAWLFVWKCKPFKDDSNCNIKFIDTVEKLENEVTIKSLLSSVPSHGDEIAEWMNNFRNCDLKDKIDKYFKYRLDNQINWYTNKANYNQKRSTQCFIAGLSSMGIGAILTIAIIISVIPSWSFLGFFTTAAVSVFSWSQTKRHDELKVTYGVSAHELSRFKSKMKNTSDENQLIDLVADVEKAISREHKLWLVKLK